MIRRLFPLVFVATAVLGLGTAAIAADAAKAKGDKAKPAAKAETKKPPPPAKPAEGGKVGYGTVVIQMAPMMAPYRTPAGVRYELITVRISLGPEEFERAACFMIPVVHEKMLLYLHSAGLQAADFAGQRREVLETKLLEVAVKATDKSLFTKVILVDANAPPVEPGSNIVVGASAPPLDPRSQTLSTQCRQ
jgi:hypothetical protein